MKRICYVNANLTNRGLLADQPVTVTIQVTRIHVRRYEIFFPTFQEAVTRLTRLKAKYSGFHWLETAY